MEMQVHPWSKLPIGLALAFWLSSSGCNSDAKLALPAPAKSMPVGSETVATGPNVAAHGETQAEPSIDDDVVFRPTFTTKQGEVAAGTAFAIQMPENHEAIMLTALHLFGPAGGLEMEIPPDRLRGAVSSISLEGCFNPELKAAFSARALTIEASKSHPERSPAGDIAAFWIPSETPIRALKLAPSLPPVGERVFLAAQVLIGASDEERIHPATVFDVDHSKMGFVYEFDNPEIHIVATSGAPVLNQKGEVVAINLGGGQHENRSFGFGNPVTAFHPFLKSAAQAEGNR